MALPFEKEVAPFANLIADAEGENLQSRFAHPKVIPFASRTSGVVGEP